jgi:hypothetical protein
MLESDLEYIVIEISPELKNDKNMDTKMDGLKSVSTKCFVPPELR